MLKHNHEGTLLSKLARLHKPPKQLFSTDNKLLDELLAQPCIAIVGTRKPTAYGRAVIAEISEKLARAGIVIISGLALGTDGLAHEHCIRAGGKTIAVLPSGLGYLYPRTHIPLAKQIQAKGGVLVTEYEQDTPPRADQFIARNRIIAALSDAVIIPEAARKSGSLHTAGFAIEMGIPVYAVPGNITSAMSSGTNQLIAQGAQPLIDTGELLQDLGYGEQKILPMAANKEEASVLELLHNGISSGAELQLQSGLDTGTFMQTMTMLELQGMIQPLGNDHWRIK